MSKTRRVFKVIGAIFAILGALALMIVPEYGFELIAALVGLWLIFIGLLLFDAGVFASALVDQAQAVLVIYVVACHLIAAVLNIVRTVGNKRDGNPGWKIDLAQFIGNITLVALCLIFIKHVEIPVYIYCAGVIYTSVLNIISSFKRTAIVYIQ